MSDQGLKIEVGRVSGMTITVEASGFDEITRRPTLDNLELVAALTKIIRQTTTEAQRQAVANVSGGQVVYSGGSFVIHRQTGKLARSIQTSFPTALSGVVVANAEYAAAIEGGVPYAVDLKPSLMGKTIFIPFKDLQGPNVPRDESGNAQVSSIAQFSSTGSRVGNRFGIFRKVGPNSKGWILPPRAPRPFMQAAAEAVLPGFEDAVRKAFADAINRGGQV